MQFVDEEDDLILMRDDLIEHTLHPLLELATVFRAGDQRIDVELDETLVAEDFGHFALGDTLGQPLDDGSLADPGLADERRIVLLRRASTSMVVSISRERPMTGSSLPCCAICVRSRACLSSVGVFVGVSTDLPPHLCPLLSPFAGAAPLA